MDVGDGHTASGRSVSHVYAAARVYNVTLVVIDAGVLVGQVTHGVVVGPPLCVVPNVKGKAPRAARRAILAAHCTVRDGKDATAADAQAAETQEVGAARPAAVAARSTVRPNGWRVALRLVYFASRGERAM